MKWTHHAGIETIEIEAPPQSPAIIILHGYGADAKDLAPLAAEMALQPPQHWYFLNAPHALEGPMVVAGRMWFPIDMLALQQAMSSGDFRDFFNNKPPQGFDEAVAQVTSFVEEVQGKHSSFTIGGFSQGSMVASQVAMRKSQVIEKLLLFSSTIVSKDYWDKSFEKLSRPFKVFQSHGTHDPVLSVSEARSLAEFFKSKNMDIQYHEFSGGHEIPFDVLQKAKVCLENEVSK